MFNALENPITANIMMWVASGKTFPINKFLFTEYNILKICMLVREIRRSGNFTFYRFVGTSYMNFHRFNSEEFC